MERGFIISLILAAIVGIFALNNSELVEIDLFFTSIFVSQAIVIFLSAIFGAVIVAFLSWVKSLRLKKEIKDLNKSILLTEDEKLKLMDLVDKKEEQIKTLYHMNTELQSKE